MVLIDVCVRVSPIEKGGLCAVADRCRHERQDSCSLCFLLLEPSC